ncbi:hypothetical protein [Nonomuraea zeae]|uniref:Uncharacterized protein n=1 Tax=Nonomuraea zeae TaxID=1642303 RepID=A0A5S4FVN7_9ACTN|nr:hypothetical protein [Nonomuraea zeae]TMR24847.1 hypothetical protein ETD85_46130 [Nonomuraea zeae]
MIDQPSRDFHTRRAGTTLLTLGVGVGVAVVLGVGVALTGSGLVAAAGCVLLRGAPSAGEERRK